MTHTWGAGASHGELGALLKKGCTHIASVSQGRDIDLEEVGDVDTLQRHNRQLLCQGAGCMHNNNNK